MEGSADPAHHRHRGARRPRASRALRGPLGALCLLALAGLPAADAPQVRLETTLGDIVIELDAKRAPDTVENFLRYVEAGFYDATIFHRVIGSFVIQGGGVSADLELRPTRPPIKNEADNGLPNLRGTIAMARDTDPHSATSQFFINVADNPTLDHRAPTRGGWGYTVFGHVVEGMMVVDEIRAARTVRRGSYESIPLEPIVIRKALVER